MKLLKSNQIYFVKNTLNLIYLCYIRANISTNCWTYYICQSLSYPYIYSLNDYG